MTGLNLDRRRFLFVLIWAMFVIKALLYSTITPLWEGFDELFHFAYVHSLTSSRSLPVWGETFIDMEIAATTGYVPLAGMMAHLAPGHECLSYSEYWRLDSSERESLQVQLFRLTASSNNAKASKVPLYQIQHPPLYYLICAPLYKVLDGRSIVDKVFALRLLSVLLASLSIVACVMIAREVEAPFITAFAVLLATWPCLYTDIARVGNDCLGVALFSFILLAMIRYGAKPSTGRAFGLGVLVGLGLLTKAYFLTAIPAVLLFIIIAGLRNKTERRIVLQNIVGAVLPIGVIGGWWYIRNFQLYGTFSGLQESVYVPSVGVLGRIEALFQISWALVAKYLFVTFSWVSGWSFLHLPKTAYLVFVAVFLVAIIGLMMTILAKKIWLEKSSTETTGLIAALCLAAFFALGVAYHAVNAFATVRHMGGPGGWYFYALVAPISFLVWIGLNNIRLELSKPLFLASLAGIMLAEFCGLICVLAPYYAGIAVQTASGWGVQTIEVGAKISLMEIIQRLLVNKPSLLSPTVLIAVACLFCLVQVAVLWLVIASVGGQKNEPDACSPSE